MRNKKGFTLIELLVVVLIIGILAAAALPQYRKSVAKARAMEAVSAVESASRAMDLAILEAGGIPALSEDALAIEIPTDKMKNVTEYDLACYKNSYCAADFYVKLNGNKVTNIWARRYSDETKWRKYCDYTDAVGKTVCEGLKPLGYRVSGYGSGSF
jgi:prepilin-type N-terminal cleavage/methylation domain-containing protein